MGCKEFECEFKDITTLSGDNGTGKSTVYDAFLWCLFGKNQRDEKAFPIKNTKDLSLNRQAHVVQMTLIVDGEEIALRKEYKEIHKHVKGSEGTQFTGHETDHFYNDVPMKAGDYKAKIDAIVSEETFKALTNVHYFNELKWEQRRAILEQVASIRTDEEIAEGNEDFKRLLSSLTGKNFAEYKKQLDAARSLVAQDIKFIPTKISEASLSKQDAIALLDEVYLRGIKEKISKLQEEKDNITKSNKSAFDKINIQQQELSNLKVKLNSATAARKSDSNAECIKLDGEIKALVQKIENIKSAIKEGRGRIIEKEALTKTLNEENAGLRADFERINSSLPPTIDPADKNCPVCKNPLNEDQLISKETTLKESWNKNKLDQTTKINEIGTKNKAKIEELSNDISKAKESISNLEKEQESIQKELDQKNNQSAILANTEDAGPSKEELQLQDQISSFKIDEPPTLDFTELDEKIKKLQIDNDACVKNMSIIESNKKAEDRITELKNQEQELSKKLLSYDKTLFVMSDFSKAKMAEIESAVNKLFNYTEVRMFEKQVNGDIDNTCTMLYAGVPYQTVNTAGRINMGLDIMGVLTDYYKIKCPVFIDNTESINEIIKTDLQIIKLQVSNEHKLTINY